ncbi:Twinkle [Chlorella vulgaris]
MPVQLSRPPSTTTEPLLAAGEPPQQRQPLHQRRPQATLAARVMRRRGLSLLQQAASATSSRLASPATAGRQRLTPLAASLHEGNGSSGNGSSGLAATRFASSSTRAPSTPAEAGAAAHDAIVEAAAPAHWSPGQRAALRDIVRSKMAALLADMQGNTMQLWRLKPEQLAVLGVTRDELRSQVLTGHGTGEAGMQQLRALVAAKQVAAMESGAGRQAAPPATAAQQPVQAQQAQQEYVPQWRAQQQAQQTAANQQYQVPPPTPPADQQPEMSPAERRELWRQQRQGQGQGQQQQQQQQQQQPSGGQKQQQSGAPAPVRASVRDLLNERRIRLPQYAPGTYNQMMCPECQGGDKSEKSLSVTIEEGSESVMWNCFRAKCGWQGRVDTRGGTSKAYRQYKNDSGFAVNSLRKRKEELPVRPTPRFDAELSPAVLDFFESRGITADTLARNRVAQETLGDGTVAVAFPYHRRVVDAGLGLDSQLVNIKYRSLGVKKFWQVKGAEKVLFGLDDVVGCQEIVIVEGEIDKLAFEEAGITNVVSVPDGAPARVKEGEVPPADQDTKFSYLWNCRAWLDQATKVVIATDNDAPGDALAEELARRLGKERCWRLRWPLIEEDHQYVADTCGVEYVRHSPKQQQQQPPTDTQQQASPDSPDSAVAATPDTPLTAAAAAAEGDAVPAPQQAEQQQQQQQQQPGGGADAAAAAAKLPELQVQPAYYRKDADEVLMRDGPAMLRAFLENAEPFPIRGLHRFHSFYEDVMMNYRGERKDGEGRSTGWPALDLFYKVVPGELTIVTGVPNSGKSEWIDALLANLAEQHDWCFALCSMEKNAPDHARQLVEKYVGKPFFDLPYARGVRRMNERELNDGFDWIDDRFHLVRYEDEALPAVEWVLDVARAAVYRYGIRGLVIDPYNELDHQRPAAMSETEYVSQMLTKVKRFAQTTGVHVWFVAHPRQMREWKGQPPNLYDISGSAHFINKADNGIVVHRDRDPNAPDQRQVQILVRKVRNKAAGTIGDCVLEYERVNGRYIDPDSPTGGPRTAQRVNFEDLARQERLAQMRADAAADAVAAIADDATPQKGAAGPAGDAPPAAAGGVGTGGLPAAARGFSSFPFSSSSLDASSASVLPGSPEQQQQQQEQPVGGLKARLRELVAEGKAAGRQAGPRMTWGSDGTISNDPVGDQAEKDAWLQGDAY